MSTPQFSSIEAQQILQTTLDAIVSTDSLTKATARTRLEQLTMPNWALGHVMDLAEQLCAIQGTCPPEVQRRIVVLFAADHGVAAEGVSLFPQEVTTQMMANFVRGGAGINALAKVANADLKIVDMGTLTGTAQLPGVLQMRVAAGTANMAQGAAMSREQAILSVAIGISLALETAPQYDLLAAGEMGIANTTAAAAILCALTGIDAELASGKGTGLDELGRRHKANVIAQSLQKNQPNANDAMDVLAKVGGFEIGAMAGFYLGCAAKHKPVLVDGFICTSAALLAQALCPLSTGYMIAAHRSLEQGHGLMLDSLGLRPLLQLGFRLGEGTGAAMAMPLFDAARALLTDVATFAEAAVSEKTSAAQVLG